MAPTLRQGQVVLVEPRTPRLGDVALVWSQGTPLVHRILDAAGDWVIHAGDASRAVGIASRREIGGRICVPSTLRVPAIRAARLLGLLLRLAVVWRVLGLPAAPPLREGFLRVKNVLHALPRSLKCFP